MSQNYTWEKIGDFNVSNASLGKGQSCEVFYAVNVKTHERVAAKKININELTANLEKQLQNEIKNLTKLNSPFIVKLLGYVRYEKSSQQNFLYLFLEYCDDIDLKRYLEKNSKGKKGLSQPEAVLFLRHIVEGYKQLHKNKIIHRDIKPANILLKQGIAKLSDFGFSRVVQDPQQSKKLTLLGTPLYTAPQILHGKQFSAKCDIWSVGILFYEMLFGRPPWNGKDLLQLRKNIVQKPIQFPGDVSRKQQYIQLIKKMLQVNSNNRISWPQLFQHPIFKGEIPKNILKQTSYTDYKTTFLDYLKNNIVKSYLRFNMEEVSFKDTLQPNEQDKKDLISKISRSITHKRNVAFLYAYVLALFYNNTNIVPKTVNQGMQFEYALAKKAFSKIVFIGTNYISKNPKEISQEQWQIFKKSSQFEELSKIVNSDYKVLHTLISQISNEIQKNFKKGLIKAELADKIKNIEKLQVFQSIIRTNQKQFDKFSKTGVCGLISYYLNYVIDIEEIEKNEKFPFGQSYETYERKYGLS